MFCSLIVGLDTSLETSASTLELDDVLKSLVSCRLQPLQWVLVEEEQMDQTEGIGVVLAKNPSKVKLANEKSLSTL